VTVYLPMKNNGVNELTLLGSGKNGTGGHEQI